MDFAMGWNKFNLSLLGVWPEPTRTSRASRYFRTIVFWLSFLVSFSFIILPQMAHLILQSTNLNEIVENLSINVPTLFALIKQIVLRYHGRGI